ncbi:unnamed protein product [Prorocentrum cordatum]|uniref:Pherophorin domain-containing protein n=1 Tax=Prorocentrum cordatum TaxID=2364126 RepID=A0ABN9VBN2_9DINO|nr:unnamed protein product [Polarella glacialis]
MRGVPAACGGYARVTAESERAPAAERRGAGPVATPAGLATLLSAAALVLGAADLARRASPRGPRRARPSAGVLLADSAAWGLVAEEGPGQEPDPAECQAGAALDFGSAEVQHATLGGQGPVSGQAGLVLAGVLPGRPFTDLVVTTSPPAPADAIPFAFRLNASLGRIGVASGSSLNFTFALVGPSIGAAAVPFHITFYDLCQAGMTLTVGGFSSYALGNHTALEAKRMPHGRLQISARQPECGGGASLGPERLSAAGIATFAFEGTAELPVEAAVAPGKPDGELVFGGGGARQAHCGAAAAAAPAGTCAPFRCPPGRRLGGGAPLHPCWSSGACTPGAGALGSGALVELCCEPAPRCSEALEFGGSSLVHNNLDGRGPAPGEPTMVFKGVLPRRREQVNLEITATSPYQAADPSRNGLNRDSLGQISVASGTSVDLVFRLVEDATWRPTILQGPVCLSVLGLEDEISTAGFAALALADDSVLQVANDSRGLTHIWGPSWPPPSGQRSPLGRGRR